MTTQPVDMAFPMRGSSIPLDHGYALFGAVSRLVPDLHSLPEIGIHPVRGKRIGPGVLALTGSSALRIRLPGEAIPLLLPLIGATLDLDRHPVHVGPPRLEPLVPSPRLHSRFVTVKGFHGDPADFSSALRKQLTAITTLARVEVEVGGRRVMQIAEHTVVGFEVTVHGLDADAAIAVQARGLGGRRHMGAGIFVPARGR